MWCRRCTIAFALLFLVLVVAQDCIAQRIARRVDSLEKVLLKQTETRPRLVLLKQLSALKNRQGATDSKSLGYFRELIRIGRQIGDSVSVAEGLLYTGFHHFLNRRLILSGQTYHYALTSLKNIDSAYWLKAQIYNVIGINYAYVGSYSTALSNYYKALAIAEKVRYWQEKADILDNMRDVFENLNQIDSVKYYSRLSLAAYQHLLANDNDSSYYCAGIGKALIALGQPQKAIEYLNMGFKISKREQSQTGMANIHKHLGVCYQMLKNYAQAKYHYLSAVSLNENQRMVVSKKLSEIAVMEKDYRQAYQYLAEYVHTVDTLRGIKIREQLFELEQLYRNMDKEREVLQAKNEAMQNKSLVNLFSGLFAVTLVILIFTGALYWQKKQNAAKLSKLNQEISYINQHLDELVQRRTDVIQRQKQQIERFAFMNAHEIRGPVATILGLVNIIVQEDLLRDNKEVEQHLQMTVQKMDKIVNHVQQTLDNEDWKNIDLPPVQ